MGKKMNLHNRSIRFVTEFEKEKLKQFLVSIFGGDIQDLANRYVECAFSNDFRRPKFILALDPDQNIVGAAAYSEELFTIGVWGISWVAVQPDFRNQGIGYALVEACLKNISEEAARHVTVVLATYPGQTRLYEKIGFIDSGRDAEGGTIMLKLLGVYE